MLLKMDELLEKIAELSEELDRIEVAIRQYSRNHGQEWSEQFCRKLGETQDLDGFKKLIAADDNSDLHMVLLLARYGFNHMVICAMQHLIEQSTIKN